VSSSDASKRMNDGRRPCHTAIVEEQDFMRSYEIARRCHGPDMPYAAYAARAVRQRRPRDCPANEVLRCPFVRYLLRLRKVTPGQSRVSMVARRQTPPR